MAAQRLYPLKFLPLLKRAIWGGRRLGTALNKHLGTGDDFAESWEICDLGPDQSIVAQGPLAGLSLADLRREFSRELLGPGDPAKPFPLLVKFIDACKNLSVQVHPNDEQAARIAGAPNGKTEAWVVVQAEPESLLYVGLKQGIRKAELCRAIDQGTVAMCLHQVPVQRGDCVFVPAGTVHAIGQGILLAEVQQSSNVTYRLFDWNRRDSAGKSRQLHIDEALEVIDLQRGPVYPVRPKPAKAEEQAGWDEAEMLVHCEEFVLMRRGGSGAGAVGGDGHFHILIGIDGDANMGDDADRCRLSRGEVVLLPAGLAQVCCRPDPDVTLLDCWVP